MSYLLYFARPVLLRPKKNFFLKNAIVGSCRDFGRNRNVPTNYGHKPEPKHWHRISDGVIVIIGVTMLGLLIDWKPILRYFGFSRDQLLTRLLTETGGLHGVQSPERKVVLRVPSSFRTRLEEHEPEIRAYLEERIRITFPGISDDEVAEMMKLLDPKDFEFRHIIAGEEISDPKDPETYVKKRNLLSKILKWNILAEEEFLSDRELVPNKIGYRDQKIIEYENRIRQYSTPDKIFRYFATIKVVDEKGHYEVMMTPQDFLRSLTPGEKQPEHLGLDNFSPLTLEELKAVNTEKLGVDKNSIFYHLGSGGLISFSDYIFLLTVLGTSRRHFEIAFKMFDLNGDGKVDVKEFQFVTNLMKSQSSMGARHRDHQSSTFKGINSGLISYLFGENNEKLLTVDKFIDFQRRLQNEILILEFKRKLKPGNKDPSKITEKDFADLLITYAGFNATKKARILKRVKNNENKGIDLQDYLNFYQVLYSINDIDTALTFYHLAGASINPATMKHVAEAVAGVELSDHVIDVIFLLFDENGDGKLSNREFLSVMKQRALRGLEKPKDTGVGKMFHAISTCAKTVAIS